MAGCVEHLSNEVGTLSINDHWNELGLDESHRTQLKEIENDYESIFSWNIQQLTGWNQNLMINLIEKVREKLEMIIDKKDEYNLNRFCLQLVVCHELYISKSYKESYLEIENIVKFMKTCKFDESNVQYSNAYCHIADATYAYIALSLKIDSEKLLKNVKEVNSFNCVEKAALCAVKAKIFMEYPPKGNDIALTFADQARTLHSTEPEWILVWLKAKGLVRRYYERFTMPDNDEINAANIWSKNTNARLLIQASNIYMEIAFINKLKYNREESNKYYKLSYDITKKSVELAKDDIQQLCSCLMICIDYPKELLSKSMMDNLIAKLTNVRKCCVDQVLGKYYLKHEKDYEKAKMYLSRGMSAGNFKSSLQLVKVECLLQPVDKFPFVQTLKMMYDVFPSPKRRLIILSQILLYYNYCENNPKEMMRYLKMYIDQDIENALKKHHLIFALPLFHVNGFRPNQFLNVLSIKLNELVNNNKWSLEERKMIDNTFDRFNKISKFNLYDGCFNDDNKTTFHSKNDTKICLNIKGKNESWRKQKVDLSSQNEFNNIHQRQFASKYVNQKNSLEKHGARGVEPLTNQHKEMYNSFELPIKIHNETNLHVVSLEQNSIKRPFSSRIYDKSGNRYGDSKSSWRNQQNVSQNQNNFETFHNHGINSKRSQGYENESLKNQEARKPTHASGNHSLSGGSCKDIDDLV
ncbi:uncharacterized protein LOC132919152 [Rhopalosiphum padi]|uniref:uncharacterized protein LOC132919152 n=1 Tax=Rhopalosiphum padi TaxID=40932 RepID=UPI00298D8B64|nr:uncharacterized protein LOC132919152 [Rhopalosiphum padi]XP_060836492.1 uncharacterized protein LOC132919152 [Rhopalosiphum padi]XP_060836501.1 uncharacterized protein LOC132919152 [Rhopalosiphum padi]